MAPLEKLLDSLIDCVRHQADIVCRSWPISGTAVRRNIGIVGTSCRSAGEADSARAIRVTFQITTKAGKHHDQHSALTPSRCLSRALGIALTPSPAHLRLTLCSRRHGRTRRRTGRTTPSVFREAASARPVWRLRLRFAPSTSIEPHTAGQTGAAPCCSILIPPRRARPALEIRRTTAQARQFVVHRHILVDGNIVDRPSYKVKRTGRFRSRPRARPWFLQIAAEGPRDVLPAVRLS